MRALTIEEISQVDGSYSSEEFIADAAFVGSFLALAGAAATAPMTLGGSLVIAGAFITYLGAGEYWIQTNYN